MENTKVLKQFLSVKDVSEMLGIPTGTIYNYICAGTIPYSKIGGHVKFSTRILEGWLKKQEHNPVE